MFNFNLEICLVVLEAVKLGRERILEVHLTLQIKIKVPTFLKAGAGVFQQTGINMQNVLFKI